MHHSYGGICFDLFGTLVEEGGNASVGAAALLQALATARIAIVTSAPRRTALALMHGAGLYVPPVVVADDDVEHGKPAADPYALAVRRLGVAPQRALAIEDSASGIASAKAAGLDAAFLLKGRPASVCPLADFYLATLQRLAAEPLRDELAVTFG